MMIFDALAFGQAFGLILLSFVIGLVISTCLNFLRMGSRL